jgi:hypothetical protein
MKLSQSFKLNITPLSIWYSSNKTTAICVITIRPFDLSLSYMCGVQTTKYENVHYFGIQHNGTGINHDIKLPWFSDLCKRLNLWLDKVEVMLSLTPHYVEFWGRDCDHSEMHTVVRYPTGLAALSAIQSHYDNWEEGPCGADFTTAKAYKQFTGEFQ